MDRVERYHRLAVKAIVWAYALVSVLGVCAFVATKAVSRTPRVAPAPPGDLDREVNLASLERGARVEASSYAYLFIHHPLFVVDGLVSPPSNKEQWVPDKRTDDDPFIEVKLARRSDVSRVVVTHDARYSRRDYILACYRAGELVGSADGGSGAGETVVFELACEDVDTVRLDFSWDPDDPQGHIRIYEIEVWGR